MAVLNSEQYHEVVLKGKQAVSMLQAKDLDGFIKYAEEGWALFPDPKINWNQAYNYAKMVFKGTFENQKMEWAKVWLLRMVENNNNLNLYDCECQYYEGKYYFEIGEYQIAYEKFRYVVIGSDFRYFDSNDTKYLDFYKSKSPI